MRYLQNVELDYRTLDKDENLYDDVDLTKEDCVDAQYWLANGYPGNPDICGKRVLWMSMERMWSRGRLGN